MGDKGHNICILLNEAYEVCAAVDGDGNVCVVVCVDVTFSQWLDSALAIECLHTLFGVTQHAGFECMLASSRATHRQGKVQT